MRQIRHSRFFGVVMVGALQYYYRPVLTQNWPAPKTDHATGSAVPRRVGCEVFETDPSKLIFLRWWGSRWS
jgi:hypothetical protein